jgi:hypothetical protein
MPYKDYEKTKQNARENYLKNKKKRLEQVKKYYLDNWETKQQQRAEWRESNPDKVKEAVRKYQLSAKGKVSAALGAKKYTEKHPERRAAHRAVHRAVKNGMLVKPKRCEECNKRSRVQAHHHKGYEKQFHLDIKWLCQKCHHKKHYDKKDI